MRLLPKFILALALLSPCAAQAQFSSGIVTATSQTVTINSQNRPVIGIAVTANTNVTLIPEATVDGTNWATIQACAISTGTCVTSITSTGSWQIGSAGMSQVRLRVSAVGATPTATLAMMASTAGGGGGGSGGGGGAVTIADGADVAEGATTDAAVAVGAAGTTEAKLRLMTTQLDNINTNVQAGTGTTGAAIPSVAVAVGGGNTAGNLTIPVLDPCQANVPTYKPFSITTNTTTNIVTGTAAKKLYVCYLYMQTAASNNVAVISGTTGATCGANTAALVGGTTAANGLNNAANGGQAMGTGGYAVMQVATANDDICVITSAATPLAGVIKYVVQ